MGWLFPFRVAARLLGNVTSKARSGSFPRAWQRQKRHVSYREKLKVVTVVALAVMSCLITYYYHFILGVCGLYCHFLYFPVILAAFWWQRRGLIVTVLLVGTLIVTHVFPGAREVPAEDYFRAFMIAAVAVITAMLSERAVKKEHALRASEERYRDLFEHSALPMVRTSEKGEIVTANRRYEELTGYSKKEMLGGMKISDLAAEDVREIVMAQHRARREGRAPESYETTIVAKSGERRSVAISTRLIPGTNEDIAIFQDITERKQMEQALRWSEERYRTLVEQSQVPISVIQDLVHVYVNPAYCRLLGYSDPEELLGQPLETTIAPPHRDMVRRRSEKRIAGEKVPSNYELQLIRKDGSVIWVEVSVQLREFEGRPAVQSASHDITARKEAEDALRESEERFRGLFDNAVVGLYRTTPSGHILMANPALVRLLGYSSFEELAQRNLDDDWFAPEYPRSKFIERVEKEGTLVGLEAAWRKKDGTTVWIRESAVVRRDDAGRIQHYEGTVEDITARKLAEEKLRDSEQRFQQVAENAQEWIWEVDANGLYTYASPVVEEVLGYRPEKLVGRLHFYDLFADDLREELKCAAFDVFQKKLPFRDFVNANTHRDGHQVLLSTSGVPVLDAEGNLLGYRGVDIDVTERKQTEKALRESEEQYRTTFENTGTAMVMVEEDMTIVLANSQFAELSGHSREEIEGKMKWTELVAPEDLERMVGYHHERRKEESRALTQYEFHLIDRDGSSRDILLNVSLIPGTRKSVGSLLDITERKRSEQELDDSRQQMRALSLRVLSAQEEERTRISREIHDELGQTLTALAFDVAEIIDGLPKEEADALSRAIRMSERIEEATVAVQRISSELRPGILDDLGLEAAIEWYLVDFQQRTGIKCELSIEPEDFTLDAGRSTVIFRVFQEALTNVARHADAARVQVDLQKRAGNLLLEVTDHGRGITAEQVSSSKSLGLIGMRERARLWNGSVTIKGTEGKGTTVLVEIPLDEVPKGWDAK